MTDGHRTTFFGTNVKMHQTLRESVAYIDELALVPAYEMQLFVILPFTSLSAVIERARRAGIWIGAQNMHWANEGEYTGEISAAMLRDVGVDLVLVGHAERRHTFGEPNALIRRKVQSALAHGLRVLLCVGETANDRDAGASAETIARQLKLALSGIDDLSQIMVAYEPVWAIGSAGSPAEPAAVASAIRAIRAYVPNVPLLYGGSVTAETAASYAALPGIDGLFVGRAARTPRGFHAVAAAAFGETSQIARSR